MPAAPDLAAIDAAAEAQGLAILGTVRLEPGEVAGRQGLVLLGPLEPGFWARFTHSPEYRDGAPDPMDRWSRRVIGALAGALDASALFPFTGPPWHPFTAWARRSGRAHIAPVGLLVHDVAGLMLSYRGALAFAHPLDPAPAAPGPCESCATRPCLAACPVDALRPGGYDVPACKADLDRPGNDCRTRGCAVRRACPLSRRYGRQEAQSAFHMGYFR